VQFQAHLQRYDDSYWLLAWQMYTSCR